ncbi:MAG: serine hydrolase [Phycisphaera sp.]|nr:serine hydrolase [Phycisphaera sp.]
MLRSALPLSILGPLLAALFACGAPLEQPAAPRQSEAPTAQPRATVLAADDAFLARCRAAAEYSRKHDGEVLLVLLDGEPVFEDAIPRFSIDTPHPLASGTKSFSGIAAALAIEDGLLSLDEKVADTIHEWKNDPRKSQVTVRQLLSLSSGLESLGSLIDNPRNARAAGMSNRVTASINAKMRTAPGERFIYGPSQFYVFGEVMKRKLAAAKTGDADLVAYLTRKVFAPLGINPRFLRDEAGNANLPGGCRLSARDWAVFGEFVRNGGVHDGKRLVGEESLAELMKPHGPNKAYGLTWWLIRDDADAADPEDALAADMVADRLEERGGAIRGRLAERARERSRAADPAESSPVLGFMAAGKGKQRLYILPEERLTIVRFGPLEGSRDFKNSEFLRILLGK